MKDSEGKSRGFGFVDFDTHEQALKCIEGMNEKEYPAKSDEELAAEAAEKAAKATRGCRR